MADKTLFTQEVDEVKSSVPDGMTLGDIRREGNKIFKYVRYNPGADEDLVVGDVLVYTDAQQTDVTGDVSDITAVPVGAGIIPIAVDLGLDGLNNIAFFWVQVKGPATVSVAIAGAPADGDNLKVDAAVDKGLIKTAGTAGERPVAVGVDVSALTVIAEFPY